MQIRDAIHEFTVALIADRLKQRTSDWYVWMLQDSPASPVKWLETQEIERLHMITTSHLRHYIAAYSSERHSRSGKPLSDSTINAMIRALHKFFNWCALEYEIANPMKRIAYPKRKKAAQRIDLSGLIESLKKMIAATEGGDLLSVRDRALLFLLLDSGMRAGGLVGMQMGDLYLEQSCALVHEKGDQWRWVVFIPETAAALRRWLDIRRDVQPAFYNLHNGNALTVSGLRSVVRHIARRAGVEQRIYTHLMRKSFTSLYTYQGGDITSVSRLLGHADIKTTMDHYVLFNSRDLVQKHREFSPLRLLLK